MQSQQIRKSVIMNEQMAVESESRSRMLSPTLSNIEPDDNESQLLSATSNTVKRSLYPSAQINLYKPPINRKKNTTIIGNSNQGISPPKRAHNPLVSPRDSSNDSQKVGTWNRNQISSITRESKRYTSSLQRKYVDNNRSRQRNQNTSGHMLNTQALPLNIDISPEVKNASLIKPQVQDVPISIFSPRASDKEEKGFTLELNAPTMLDANLPLSSKRGSGNRDLIDVQTNSSRLTTELPSDRDSARTIEKKEKIVSMKSNIEDTKVIGDKLQRLLVEKRKRYGTQVLNK